MSIIKYIILSLIFKGEFFVIQRKLVLLESTLEVYSMKKRLNWENYQNEPCVV